ncbi:Sin-like protein conserved region-domain-containing protein [Exophiala viscosa]|uniref:Sin-like protein conserved region-domain-containing protein n=1 Tax=Exophiala viscosa TaxID=2486360 RepID=A0AAN6DQY2_9EURO|nr:Sin-like protein conserved region-domain-containing protein [Exophiala viscosa]KAI1624788.1 Sin-like protein conserved region-domain-containing protein [Exophiala viscosa]
MDDEDDPVVASYDVYLTSAPAKSSKADSSKIYVLQYPSHRKKSRPYNVARGQAPTSFRLKPTTGFLEVDVPMFTEGNYNPDMGEKLGKALSRSHTLEVGGSHGLGGGFSSGGPAPSRMVDIPMHDRPPVGDTMLASQTLGGKIVAPSARDPIYFLGRFEDNQLNLTRVNGVVQLRPQLHHLDAEDELNQKRFQTGNNAAAAKQKPGLETSAQKMESKAISIKIKDTKEDARDRSLNENARLLRDIQVEPWQHHYWIDEDEEGSRAAFETTMHLGGDGGEPKLKLKSALSNGDWLDKMSAPREDGKKGLLAKLRGRERERARRKKAEEEKRQRQREVADGTTIEANNTLDMSSDSDLSSPEASESEAGEDMTMTGTENVDSVPIKEEPTASGSISNAATTPKKRGRPKKNPGPDAASGDG